MLLELIASSFLDKDDIESVAIDKQGLEALLRILHCFRNDDSTESLPGAACRALFHFCKNVTCAKLVVKARGIDLILKAMKTCPENGCMQNEGACSLLSLCCRNRNIRYMLDNDIYDLLFKQLEVQTRVAGACYLLERIARCIPDEVQIILEKGVVDACLNILRKTKPDHVDFMSLHLLRDVCSACSLLASLAANDAAVKNMIILKGGIKVIEDTAAAVPDQDYALEDAFSLLGILKNDALNHCGPYMCKLLCRTWGAEIFVKGSSSMDSDAPYSPSSPTPYSDGDR